jgi:hypothetical protein
MEAWDIAFVAAQDTFIAIEGTSAANTYFLTMFQTRYSFFEQKVASVCKRNLEAERVKQKK